jgi:flagellar assembly protein FliH
MTFLSRIIKSSMQNSQNVDEFSFKQIRQGNFVGQAGDSQPCGFTPMSIFDSSEMRGMAGGVEEVVEPPSITLLEDEFQQQLREAFENGLTEGKNLAERGLVNVFRSLRSAAEGVEALRDKILRESEDELVSLIILVARKVILKEILQDRTILSNVVQAAIESVSERDEITIRLNPDDYALITTGHGDLLRKELVTGRMNLKSDPTVLPGSCMIDSELGTVDAGIDAQLDEIYRGMQEERTMSVSTTGR